MPSIPLWAGAQTGAHVARSSLVVVSGGGENLLTVRAVAARLSVSTATVYAICERGDLPHVRISNAIRVAPGVLEAFIASLRGT